MLMGFGTAVGCRLISGLLIGIVAADISILCFPAGAQTPAFFYFETHRLPRRVPRPLRPAGNNFRRECLGM
jgi:hypothetical protein